MERRRRRAAAMAMGSRGEEGDYEKLLPTSNLKGKQEKVRFGGKFGAPGRTPDEPAVQPAPPDHPPNCLFLQKS